MKTPHQDIDINKMHQVAQDMVAHAFMLHHMESDPNGTLSLTANNLMAWAELIFNALEDEGKTN